MNSTVTLLAVIGSVTTLAVTVVTVVWAILSIKWAVNEHAESIRVLSRKLDNAQIYLDDALRRAYDKLVSKDTCNSRHNIR